MEEKLKNVWSEGIENEGDKKENRDDSIDLDVDVQPEVDVNEHTKEGL